MMEAKRHAREGSERARGSLSSILCEEKIRDPSASREPDDFGAIQGPTIRGELTSRLHHRTRDVSQVDARRLRIGAEGVRVGLDRAAQFLDASDQMRT